MTVGRGGGGEIAEKKQWGDREREKSVNAKRVVGEKGGEEG